jgi:serine phosphatase RsbU (regulator of sigma subunit)
MELVLTGMVGGENRRFALSGPLARAGRSSANAVQLLDGTVSKEHAEFRLDAGRWTVRDLGSRNGTRVNGVDATQALAVGPGDAIEVGHVVLRVTGGEEAAGETRFSDSRGLGSSIKLRVSDVLQRPTTSGDSGRIMHLLAEAGQLLVLPRPLRETCEELLGFVQKAVPASRLVLLLRPSPGEQPVPMASRRTGGRPGADREPLALSQTILRTVLEENTAVITRDTLNDPRFMGHQSIIAQAIHGAMAVPLFDNQSVLGILYVDTSDPRVEYNEEHLELLTLLGNMAAVKITNARLLEAEAARARMAQELATATRIQQALLPTAPTDAPGWQFHARLETCFEVGGDLYDFHTREDGIRVVMLGDVSGKGMGAALLMSSVLSSARVLYDTCDDPLALVQRLNKVTYRSSDRGSFVTLFVGYLDPVTGRLRYVNAGHPEAEIVGGAATRSLAATGVPVGMLPDFPWTADEITLERGETMAVFSDGIPEAQHGAEFFEFERLRSSLVELASEPDLARVADGMIERIDAFAAGEHRADDVTLLLLRRT